MPNKLLLALFVLFLLTLLGWCSPQCSRQFADKSVAQTSDTTTDTATSSPQEDATSTTDMAESLATSGSDSTTPASETAAETASSTAADTMDSSASATGNAINMAADAVESAATTATPTGEVATMAGTSATESAAPEEPAPVPEDFASSAATTSDKMSTEGESDNPSVTEEDTAEPAATTSESEKLAAALASSGTADSGVASVILEGVTFATNSDQLTAGSIRILELVVGNLKQKTEIVVEIAGYTDNTGDPGYNVDLSQRRAETVVGYLTRRGIDASRLTAKGYGADAPIADNDTAAGREKNRRVEMHVK